MHFSWNAPLSKAVMLQEEHGTKDLRFYGVSIGWLGLGFVVGVDRQPTPRAVDLLESPEKLSLVAQPANQ